MHYEISPARYEDVDAIAELARQSGELHQEKEPTYFRKCALSNNAEYIKNVIDDEYAEVFKACDENKKVVGYLTLYLHDCSKEFFVYKILHIFYILIICFTLSKNCIFMEK